MAELRIRVPGEPERVVPLRDRPVVIGRAADCDVQVLEKKASKRHLQIAPVPGPGGAVVWVATDLQSSNGTLFGSERILRRALVPGDVLKLADTTVELVAGPPAATAAPASPGEPAAPPTIVVSGGLSLEPAVRAAPPAEAARAAASPSPAPAEEPLADDEAASAAESHRSAVAGRRVLTRAGVFLAVAVLALVGVQVFVGQVADERVAARREAEAFEAILADRDRPYEILEKKFQDFVAEFPRSRRRADLEKVVAAKREEEDQRQAAEAELEALQRNAVGRSESEILGRLLALRVRVGEGSPLDRRVQLALADAARRRDEAVARDRGAAEAEADRALARGDPAAALRRLAAFEASHPRLPVAEADRLAAKRKAVREEATRLADAALEKAKGEADPDARRAVLLAALRGLADTAEADRLASAVSRVTGGAVPTAAPPGAPPTVPGTPPPAAAPLVTPALLGQAADAERLARERKWAAAAEVYGRLGAADVAPRVREEWRDRADSLGRVARLVEDLVAAVAAAGDHPFHVKLEAGTFEVLSADAAGARLRRGEKETTLAWADASHGDLLALLGHGKPTPDRHLALAILATDLGERAEAVAHLVPLVDVPTHRDLAFRLMARRLDGRASVPEGGYQVFDGDLVDRAEAARRSEAKAVDSLKAEAASLVAKAASDPAFKALAKLRARRDELDRRRAYALLAIFDEKHWPYPHDDPAFARQYEIVTAEVTRRWTAVQEVWDEPLTVKLPKDWAVDKVAERHAAVVKALEAKGVDTTALRAAMAPYAVYAGETALTIRTYFRDADEKDLLAYNRWVMDVYNPSRTAVVTDPEREQTRITNEYRMMMGYALRVEPGPAAYASIDAKNVAHVIDQGKEVGRVALHAVRIDDRLVTSARGHSLDMGKRGYFAHQAPANPATGEPATMPWDRMHKAGYDGAASENIAKAPGPLQAHLEWLSSSGHHRNIVSDWSDVGVGQSGNLWTQNFGNGGGAPREIPGKAPPADAGPGGGGN